MSASASMSMSGAWVHVAVFVAAAAAAWLVLRLLPVAVARHRQLFSASVGAQLADAFLFVSPERLWRLAMAVAGGAALIAFAVSGSTAVAAGSALACGVLPRALLARMRRRRLRRFRAQLPDALMLIAGGLRAGQGVMQAIASAVAETEAPVSQEFGLMLREQRLGRSFEQALGSVARRNPLEEMALLEAAARVSVDAGGSLAEALERLAETLRSALVLEAKIEALTSQGRLQARVLVALPPLLALVLLQLDPIAMRPLFDTAIGRAVCAVVLVLDLLGLLWIRRIVRIDP